MKESVRKYIFQNWQLYIIFILPAFILTFIFKYVPMGGVLLAFEEYSPRKGLFLSEWVGLMHFKRFLASPDFLNYLLNTVKLSLYGLIWGFPVPIIIALLLNRISWSNLQKKIQLIIYAPNFISVIVLCGMTFIFLSPIGPVNKFMGTSINFMTMPEAFRSIFIISGIWQGAGWGSIMYTAALSNSSTDLRDASIIDGAGLLKQIWHVDIQAIKPIIVIQFILQAGNIMSLGFEKAYALQTSMNISASEIIPTYVYKIGLQNGDYSFSTAVGLFNSLINLVLLIFVNQIVKKFNDNEGL